MSEHDRTHSMPSAERSAGERQMMIKSIFVRHDRFEDIFRFIERTHYPVVGGEADFGSISVIAGESRAGKSFAAKRYVKNYPAAVGEIGMICPVIYLEIPTDGQQRALLEALADSLGIRFSQRVNTHGLMEMVIQALCRHKVELLIMDEVNTIVHSSNKRGVNFAMTLFRKILNRCQLNIICIGLEETYDLLAADPQLTGRGGLPTHFVRAYEWKCETEQKLFRLLCDEIDGCLPFEKKSGLGSVWSAQRLYHSSNGGHIGRLKDFIYAAGCIAINDSSASIEVRHFAEAYDRIKPRGNTFNPWVHDPNLAPPLGAEGNPLFAKHPRDVFSKKMGQPCRKLM